MKAKKLQFYEDMANDRIKLKKNILYNDRVILNYMIEKKLDKVGEMTQADFKRRIKQNEKYLQLAGN